MRTALVRMARTVVVAAALVLWLGVGVGERQAAGGFLPSACVWTAAAVLGGTTSTATVDAAVYGSACPDLPPDEEDPCPDGDGTFTRQTVTSVGAHYEVLACVENLP